MKLKSLWRFVPITLALVLTVGAPATAFAYVGPGAGLSIIGSLLAFIAAIVIGIFGFLWFPIRRILRRRKQAAADRNSDEVTSAADEQVSDQGADEKRQGENDA